MQPYVSAAQSSPPKAEIRGGPMAALVTAGVLANPVRSSSMESDAGSEKGIPLSK